MRKGSRNWYLSKIEKRINIIPLQRWKTALNICGVKTRLHYRRKKEIIDECNLEELKKLYFYLDDNDLPFRRR